MSAESISDAGGSANPGYVTVDELPAALVAATEHQQRARIALTAALAGSPSHAYLFEGPPGSGKRSAARAFAAEILAAGAADPDDARRRALLDPSPHPDLTWVAPRGARHLLVDDVRDRVIKAVAYRPFEGERRVFVLEGADTMNDESQNALLKTLEEPPAFAHLILLASEPDRLAETIASRCQTVPFFRERARLLAASAGAEARDQAEAFARAALDSGAEGAPWRDLLAGAEQVGAEAARAVEAELEAELEGVPPGRPAARIRREGEERAKRALRRARTTALDLGLELCSLWFRDLAVIAAGAPGLAFAADRAAELAGHAAGLAPARALAAVELVADTRRRLELNVSEELALEALFYRLQAALAGES